MRALALTGPTASGKTALSLLLSMELGCEIISLDSMQIYREMDIGTAKATREQRASVPHHMLDVASPLDAFSTEDYRVLALECVRDVLSRGRIPLFVGGTGLYLDTLMRGASPASPPSDGNVRARLMSEASKEGGADRLYERLLLVDPITAEKTHRNNLRRVVRALEIYELTGKSKSCFDELSRTSSPDITVGHITLDFHNRDNLYRRVDMRVDEMVAEGLVEEVRSLYSRGLLSENTTAGQAIGYKELIRYLRGELSLDAAVELIKQSSRRYAKRQLTWFRNKGDATAVYVDTECGAMRYESDVSDEIIRIARELYATRQN